VSESDARPRPQYGEYATPEEQRARIQRPEVTDALDAGIAPTPEVAPSKKESAADPSAATSAKSPAAAVKRGPLLDRVATFGLLGYGLISIFTNIAQVLDFPTFAETTARMMGVTATFTNLTAGYVWGAVAAAVYGIGWLLTAVLTWRRLKTGRISFWIPLVGFVVTTVIASVCVLVPLLGDAEFLAALTQGFGV